jgi:uncharacterized protein (TIGR01777 family)
MKILLSGASGLIGTRLATELAADGHTLVRLVRRSPAGASERLWDPDAGTLNPEEIQGVDAVVHLGGVSVGEGRWTTERKRAILDSRVKSTELLARTLATLPTRPEVFVCASATGFYGDRGDEVLTEASPAGTGFLAEVCLAWEAACAPARDAGVRVVNTRFGVVLDPTGGALGKMLTPFKLGLGGRLGPGTQWMSWVSAADTVAALRFALQNKEVRGPINVVAPEPATNQAFTKALGKALHRPTFLPAPAAALRLALGEMADAALLSSTRAVPKKLQDAGFRFQDTHLQTALEQMLAAQKK